MPNLPDSVQQLELFEGVSPFDQIRQVRKDGTEFWSARELQPLMGYTQWRNFREPLIRAKGAARTAGHDVETNFAGSRKVATVGKMAQEDFHLTRFAAYLVAMNGDPNKKQVAAAQTYFAVQTRVAETAAQQPATVNPSLVSRADLARMILEAEEELSIANAALESAIPAIAYHDRFVIDSDVVTVKCWAAQFGITEPAARKLLLDAGIIYKSPMGERWSGTRQRREEVHEYRAYSKYLEWFDLRPQHNAPRHHNGQVRQTLYVRQQFALDLGAKLGLSSTQGAEA